MTHLPCVQGKFAYPHLVHLLPSHGHSFHLHPILLRGMHPCSLLAKSTQLVSFSRVHLSYPSLLCVSIWVTGLLLLVCVTFTPCFSCCIHSFTHDTVGLLEPWFALWWSLSTQFDAPVKPLHSKVRRCLSLYVPRVLVPPLHSVMWFNDNRGWDWLSFAESLSFLVLFLFLSFSLPHSLSLCFGFGEGHEV